jgi:hypothetical protein
MAKLKNLKKIFENETHIFYWKRTNRQLMIYRAEKHRNKICKFQRVGFDNLINTLKRSEVIDFR